MAELVVCVDDEAPVLAALRRLLRREPYELLTTSDPREALGWTETRDVSLVVSDYRMPEMNGVELLLSVQERSPLTARVLLTAHPGERRVLETRRQDLFWLAAKPWDGETLKREIRTRLEERRRLERELLALSERERRRVGQELHDALGQDLTGLTLLCRALEERLRERWPDGAEEAARITELARKAAGCARSLAHGLHPSLPAPDALGPAFARLAASTQAAYGVDCRASWDPSVVPRGAAVAAQLYWIVHEALTNALRHAKPALVTIDARRDGAGARLTIRDDGSGLPPDAGDAPGIGLQIMKSRARQIGAELRVERDPEGGTRVVCDLPPSALKS